MGIRSYRQAGTYRTGTWAWILHRLSGLFLLGYLYFHLVVLSSAVWPEGPVAFDRAVGLVTSPPFIVADLALFAVVFYHAFNGVRVLLIDAGWLISRQRTLFWWAVAVGLAALAGSAAYLLPASGL